MVIEVVRIVNLLLGVAALAVLAARYHRWFCRRPSCMASPALTVLLTLIISYGAAEALIYSVPGGLRTWLYALGQLAILTHAATVTDAVSCRVGAKGRWRV